METKHPNEEGSLSKCSFKNSARGIRCLEFSTIQYDLVCGSNLFEEVQMTAPCLLWFVVILDFENVFPTTSSRFFSPHEIRGHQGNNFKFDKQKALQYPHYQKALISEDNFI